MSGRMTRLVFTGIVAVGLVAASLFVWISGDDAGPAAGDATATASANQIALGRTVFQAKGCIGCHQITGIEGGRSIGPNLTRLNERAGSRVEGTSAEAYVIQSITAPQAHVEPGYGGSVEMPRIEMTQAELDALVTFLLSEHES